MGSIVVGGDHVPPLSMYALPALSSAIHSLVVGHETAVKPPNVEPTWAGADHATPSKEMKLRELSTARQKFEEAQESAVTVGLPGSMLSGADQDPSLSMNARLGSTDAQNCVVGQEMDCRPPPPLELSTPVDDHELPLNVTALP